MKWGAAAGGGSGLAFAGYLEWFFVHGPGAASSDAGMAHGFWVYFAGIPLSLLDVGGRPGAFLSIGASWALFGAMIPWAARHLLSPARETPGAPASSAG